MGEMARRKVVIVGGVAVGAGVAAKVRRLDELADIVLFEKGPYVSFANCGLPYYLGEVIQERTSLLLHTPESLRARFNIQVKTHHEVLSIDRIKKTVLVGNLTDGTSFEESYDKLVIAVGARPIMPPTPGIRLPGIFELRTVPDADKIKAWVKEMRARRAVVVGAGFIGLETVENLTRLGLSVTLITRGPQILSQFDREMTAAMREQIEDLGVETIFQDQITSFRGDTRVREAVLESGRLVLGDLFLMGVGVKPDFHLAKEAGLMLGVEGALKVNAHLQTSDPDIYAGGDVAEMTHLVSQQSHFNPLAGTANKQARVIAQNICGGHESFSGALGTAIVRVGKTVVALTGLTEKLARREGVNYAVSYTTSGHHAGYYPGATDMTIKLLVDRSTHRLLGAQIAGQEGVDKRIDVFATAIAGRLTVEDLATLDLAYAPPFSSAKDPVIMAAMAAEHIVQGDVQVSLSVEEMQERGATILDVRTTAEVAGGKLPGALNIPLDELRDRIGELDLTRPLAVYCRSGQRSYFAYQFLRGSGAKEVYNFSGGWVVQEMFRKAGVAQ